MELQPGKDVGSRALLICPDERMFAELSGAVAAHLPNAKPIRFDAYPGHVELTSIASASQVCFLDVTTNVDAAALRMDWLAADSPDLPVIALLHSNNPDLILRFLRRGCAEFLIPPFTGDQFSAVLHKLARFRGGYAPAPSPGGKVISVFPGKGASGATTLACSLAFAFKNLNRGKVLLADLDGLTGTIAFVLKLKPAYSFIDAVGQSGSLDADMWKAVVTASHGVDVLLSPENPVDSYSEELNPSALVGSARQAYDIVVLDAGGVHGEWNNGLARLADELLLVTTSELPVLHSTKRSLAALDRFGLGHSHAHVVLNRYQSKAGLAEEAVGTALGLPVYRTLPNDTVAIRKALMEGKPVPASTAFGRSVLALARAISGQEESPAETSVIARLKGLFS